jgi:hypothetical protein
VAEGGAGLGLAARLRGGGLPSEALDLDALEAPLPPSPHTPAPEPAPEAGAAGASDLTYLDRMILATPPTGGAVGGLARSWARSHLSRARAGRERAGYAGMQGAGSRPAWRDRRFDDLKQPCDHVVLH